MPLFDELPVSRTEQPRPIAESVDEFERELTGLGEVSEADAADAADILNAADRAGELEIGALEGQEAPASMRARGGTQSATSAQDEALSTIPAEVLKDIETIARERGNSSLGWANLEIEMGHDIRRVLRENGYSPTTEEQIAIEALYKEIVDADPKRASWRDQVYGKDQDKDPASNTPAEPARELTPEERAAQETQTKNDEIISDVVELLAQGESNRGLQEFREKWKGQKAADGSDLTARAEEFLKEGRKQYEEILDVAEEMGETNPSEDGEFEEKYATKDIAKLEQTYPQLMADERIARKVIESYIEGATDFVDEAQRGITPDFILDGLRMLKQATGKADTSYEPSPEVDISTTAQQLLKQLLLLQR